MKRLASRRFARPAAAVLAGAALLSTLLFSGLGAAAQPGAANLKITNTDDPDPVHVGSELTYSIGVEDLGPVIVSFGGNDRIVGRAGRDLICAGRGNDYVGAGTAADGCSPAPDATACSAAVGRTC
jgi:hypothetical protein